MNWRTRACPCDKCSGAGVALGNARRETLAARKDNSTQRPSNDTDWRTRRRNAGREDDVSMTDEASTEAVLLQLTRRTLASDEIYPKAVDSPSHS
ncbi:unnamed protein product [Protopolystoma xenopodis]|uniref:Uncharacterized protein n=1 Tax=Protopolystoma xenopodis TaxID=117903 RepID=A0A3S5FFA1_9PLAT|nr:unnamed protein product [Protopolystoma xenopodis]